MAKPNEILSPEEYKNYRNVRAVSVLFCLLGSILVLAGIPVAINPSLNPEIPRMGAAALAIVGLAGAVGGFAALRGQRHWAPLVYVIAALYIAGFPIGTILSLAIFKGLPGYLQSVDRLRVA